MAKLAFNEEFLDPKQLVKGFLFSLPYTDCELATLPDNSLVATLPACELWSEPQTVTIPDTASVKNGKLTWIVENIDRNVKQTIWVMF